MTARGIDVVDVRAALRTRAVLEHYGWKTKRSGVDEIESTSCPARGDHSRRAFVINVNTGRWQCFPCGIGGDLLSFIAGIDNLTDFQDVLAKAAEIAGVGPSTLSEDERARKRAEYRRQQLEAEAAEEAARVERYRAAVPFATSYWSHLLPTHDRGLSYLASRHVDEVVELEPCVRFDPDHEGSPAVPLYNSAGEIHNVVARRLPELGEPKTPGLFGCPTPGTLVHPVTRIDDGRDVVITEGVMDSLTARLAFHAAIILGAHAADNLVKVAQVAAPIVAAKRGRMFLVVHDDPAGERSVIRAGEVALDAGLSLRKGTLRLVKHGHKDLNDAWIAGWRAS